MKKKDRPRKKAAAAVATTPVRPWLYPAAFAGTVLIVFLVYSPALHGPFVFDDIAFHVPDYAFAWQSWARGVRPLLMMSCWLNYQISNETFSFHIVNVLLHAINSLLVFFIVRKLVGKATLAAAFASAIFLLHPIQTESVAYIAGRSESLSVMFFFAAFTVFLYRRQETVSWQVAVTIFFLFGLALATKEHTLVLPGLLLLTDYYWNPGFALSGIRRNWRIYAPIALGAAGGVAFVVKVLLQSRSAGFGMHELTWYQYFFTECRAFFVYLRLIVWPVGQNIDWDYPLSRSILDHGAFFAFAAILLLTSAAIYYRRRYPLASYGVLVYLLLMAPTSSFVPIKDPMAEHRLYLPMIGILLVVADALRRLRMDRRKLAAACAAVAVVLAVLSYQRNQLWGDDIALWQDTVRKSPDKARIYYHLAFSYYMHGKCQDALVAYAELARRDTMDHNRLVDWGLAYECAGQPDEAVAKLRQAAALKPTAHVYSQIGMVYARQARWAEALEALAQAEKLDPYYAMTYYYRAGVRVQNHDYAGAADDYRRVLWLDPTNEPARAGLDYIQQPNVPRPSN